MYPKSTPGPPIRNGSAPKRVGRPGPGLFHLVSLQKRLPRSRKRTPWPPCLLRLSWVRQHLRLSLSPKHPKTTSGLGVAGFLHMGLGVGGMPKTTADWCDCNGRSVQKKGMPKPPPFQCPGLCRIVGRQAAGYPVAQRAGWKKSEPTTLLDLFQLHSWSKLLP